MHWPFHNILKFYFFNLHPVTATLFWCIVPWVLTQHRGMCPLGQPRHRTASPPPPTPSPNSLVLHLSSPTPLPPCQIPELVSTTVLLSFWERNPLRLASSLSAMPLRRSHAVVRTPVWRFSAKCPRPHGHPSLPICSPTGLFPGFGNYNYNYHRHSHTGFCAKIYESLSSLLHVMYFWTRNLKPEKNSHRREQDTLKRIFYWRLQLQCLRESCITSTSFLFKIKLVHVLWVVS